MPACVSQQFEPETTPGQPAWQSASLAQESGQAPPVSVVVVPVGVVHVVVVVVTAVVVV
jgi:hypothetical protein